MSKIIKPIVFMLILTAVLYGVYNVLSWKDTTGDYQSVTSQLNNTQDDLIDVVFLGSSHCYTNINPCVLWNDYGIAAFDMSVSGQDKNSTYYDLKELLKTQSPSIVCVDMYGLLFDEQEVEGNVYRNMLALPTGRNSVDLVNAYVDEEDRWNFYLRWPIVHTRYRELDKYDFVENDVNIYGRGEGITFSDGAGYFPADLVNCNDTTELSEANIQWIDKLYELSMEEDFQLVFFMAPYASGVEDQMIINMLALYAQDMEVPFIDFNKISMVIGYDYTTDATDHLHSNAGGAAKITDYFGRFLCENYEMNDHRGDEKYWQWDKDCQYFAQRQQEDRLNRCASMDEYLSMLIGMENVTAVISLDGYYDLSMHYLSYFNVPEEMYAAGGKWIYENGIITYIMDNESSEEYLYDVSDYDTFLIQNDENYMNNVKLGNESVMSTSDGINITVYDTFQQKLISVRGE